MTKKITNPSDRVRSEAVRGTTTGSTGAAYATAKTVNMQNYQKLLLHIIETGGANSIKYKVEASICAVVWHEIKAETTIAASGDEYETITDAWSYVRVRVINGSGVGAYGVCWQLK